jgi:hypothetical protein
MHSRATFMEKDMVTDCSRYATKDANGRRRVVKEADNGCVVGPPGPWTHDKATQLVKPNATKW